MFKRAGVSKRSFIATYLLLALGLAGAASAPYVMSPAQAQAKVVTCHDLPGNWATIESTAPRKETCVGPIETNVAIANVTVIHYNKYRWLHFYWQTGPCGTQGCHYSSVDFSYKSGYSTLAFPMYLLLEVGIDA